MVSKDHPDGDWKRIDSKGNVKETCARKPVNQTKVYVKSSREQNSLRKNVPAVRAKRKHDPVADRAVKVVTN